MDTKIIHHLEYKVSSNYSQLVYLDRLLKKNKKRLSDISGLAVITGFGSFTATRLSTTLANTLAFALKIKVAAIKKEESGEWLKILMNAENGQYVLPKYSSPAHISGKKTPDYV